MSWCPSFSFTSKISFIYFQFDSCHFLHHPPLICLLTLFTVLFLHFSSCLVSCLTVVGPHYIRLATSLIILNDLTVSWLLLLSLF